MRYHRARISCSLRRLRFLRLLLLNGSLHQKGFSALITFKQSPTESLSEGAQRASKNVGSGDTAGWALRYEEARGSYLRTSALFGGWVLRSLLQRSPGVGYVLGMTRSPGRHIQWLVSSCPLSGAALRYMAACLQWRGTNTCRA